MLRDMIPGELINYMDKHWKPNQDDNFLIIEKGSSHFKTMSNAFDYYFNLSPTDRDENAFNVGPFVGIRPYGVFDDEEDPTKTEFLFEYDDIDRSQLKQHHLML